MGRFDEPLLPANPRTRKLIENDQWTAYDVVLDVWPEVFAWGVLVVPKGIKPGERRPVVVCQHGRNGLPRMLVDGNETAYNQFAARLAERGFVTFAPHKRQLVGLRWGLIPSWAKDAKIAYSTLNARADMRRFLALPAASIRS